MQRPEAEASRMLTLWSHLPPPLPRLMCDMRWSQTSGVTLWRDASASGLCMTFIHHLTISLSHPIPLPATLRSGGLLRNAVQYSYFSHYFPTRARIT